MRATQDHGGVSIAVYDELVLSASVLAASTLFVKMTIYRGLLPATTLLSFLAIFCEARTLFTVKRYASLPPDEGTASAYAIRAFILNGSFPL